MHSSSAPSLGRESGSSRHRPHSTATTAAAALNHPTGAERAEEAIRVFVRIRPPITAAETLGTAVAQVGPDQVRLRYDKHDVSCKYSRAFGQDATQEDLFGAVKPLLSDALNGINCAIFAYGQTSAGKTHTMLGPDGGNDMAAADPGLLGILPRAVDFIFSELSRLVHEEGVRVQVKLSYMQIYNEVIHDLLRDRVMLNDDAPYSQEGTLPGLKLREYIDPSGHGKHEIFVSGLSEFRAETSADVLRMLLVGSANRSTRATDGNASSSRSHAILQLTLEIESQIEGGQTVINRCKLSFVDLAGSEKMASMGANEGDPGHLRELTSINKSLSALGNVIAALAKQKAHIPYRDSKLTRLLQDSLGGNTRTLLIACVAPTLQHASETFNTLQFADRAASVMVRVKPNVVIDDKALLCRAQVEIARLKRLLRYVMSGPGYEKGGLQSEPGTTVVEAMAAGAVVSGAVGVQEEEAVAAESEMIRLLDENEKLRSENLELKRKLAKFQARMNLQQTPVYRPGVWSPVKKPPASQSSAMRASSVRKSILHSPAQASARPFSSLENSPYAVVRSMTSVAAKREPSPQRPTIAPVKPSSASSEVGSTAAKATIATHLDPISEQIGEPPLLSPSERLTSIMRNAVESAERAVAAEEAQGSPLRGKVRRKRKERAIRSSSPVPKPKAVATDPEAAGEKEPEVLKPLSVDTSVESLHQQATLSTYLPRGMRVGGGLVARLTTPILRSRATGKSGAKSKKKRKVRAPSSDSSDSEASGSPKRDLIIVGGDRVVAEDKRKSSPLKQMPSAQKSDAMVTSIDTIVDKLVGTTDREERAKKLGECIDWVNEESEMRAIESALSKHSRSLDAELAEEERALKVIEAEKLKLLRLLEIQKQKDARIDEIEALKSSNKVVEVSSRLGSDGAAAAAASKEVPATAPSDATAASKSMGVPNDAPKINDISLPSRTKESSNEISSVPAASSAGPTSKAGDESSDDSSSSSGTEPEPTAAAPPQPQKTLPARLAHSSADVGRGIEMYILAYDSWSDVDILEYSAETGKHKCVVHDGAGPEREQWIDLKKKPIRAK